MASVLRVNGYDVTEATDGLQALKLISLHSFQAVVLDLVLPHVDGWQFRTAQLQHPDHARIPTVIVSARPLRDADLYTLRARIVVPKPFEDADLLGALHRACAEAPQAVPVMADLFWSRRGAVACSAHAPAPTGPEWQRDQWTAVPLDANTRLTYQCQHCAADRSPIRRGTVASQSRPEGQRDQRPTGWSPAQPSSGE
jgi:CheY-like chemotaxis protein